MAAESKYRKAWRDVHNYVAALESLFALRDALAVAADAEDDIPALTQKRDVLAAEAADKQGIAAELTEKITGLDATLQDGLKSINAEFAERRKQLEAGFAERSAALGKKFADEEAAAVARAEQFKAETDTVEAASRERLADLKRQVKDAEASLKKIRAEADKLNTTLAPGG